MISELTIKSSGSAGKLRLSEARPSGRVHPVEYINVSLQDRDIAAPSPRIYLFEPYDLVAFFEELASAWKGWIGKKEWSSVQGDFSLSCTSDNLGHVAMRVNLKSGLYEDDWSVQAIIHIDSGQLAELAVKVRAFFL
ncbi:MAG TPA: DUF6228 family protein [Pyrinomonadaceae bacterium]|nr:DUF6228 family protein [Pyrinomonadaceae bacterium]